MRTDSEGAVAAPGAKKWNRLDTEERRGQILDAARRRFAERPYGSVSTVEIAEAAGVTRGLLHHYFGTKRELYLEAVRELVDAPVMRLFDSMIAVDGPARQLTWEQSVDTWMELVEANQEGWLQAINVGETGRDHTMREILEQARDRTASQVMRVLGLDHDDRPEVRSLVLGYGRMAEEITREWLERGRLGREQARAILVGALPMMVDKLLPTMATS